MSKISLNTAFSALTKLNDWWVMVKDNFLSIVTGHNALEDRVDNIVASSGTSNTEIVDARHSVVKNKTFPVLTDRLEETETEVTTHMADYLTLKPSGEDDTAAIQAKLTSIPDGKTLRFLSGTYIISGATRITCTKNINIECEEGVIFDVTGCTANPVFLFAGSLGTFYQLGADVAQKATQITVHATLASTLTIGDIVYISTDTAHGGSGELWCPSREYYFKGEQAMVESVSGTTVKLTLPLWDNYTAANTVVCKVDAKNIIINNMKMVGSLENTQEGIFIRYAKHAIVHNVHIKSMSYSCLAISNSFSFSIRDCLFSDFYKSGSGASYGIGIYSCQNGVVDGNVLTGGRHGIAHGGTNPCRNIKIINNTCCSEITDFSGGIDTHENCEYITISNNYVGSLSIFGRNIRIDGNTIIKKDDVGDTAIKVCIAKEACDYMIITNNYIDAIEVNLNDGIYVQSNTLDNIDVASIIISGNKIKASNIGIQIHSYKTNFLVENINIHSNDIVMYDKGATIARCISISQNGVGLGFILNNLAIQNNYLFSYGTNIQLGANGQVTNNVLLNGNTIRTDRIDVMLINIMNAAYVMVNNNHLQANKDGTTNAYIYMVLTGKLSFTGNRMVKMKKAGFFLECPLMLIRDNVYIDTDMASPILTGIVVTEITHKGNYVTYGTTAPTTGTWGVGDICKNTSPTLVKNISHWECITAGTSGAWMAYGCGSGTTAARPVLTANDAGYLYYDTTTTTKIYWTGTAWA